MILAMSGFLTFLIIVGLVAVVLEYTDRRRSLFVGPAGSDNSRDRDRDRDRVIADLEARRD
jgi:hypothetical protein